MWISRRERPRMMYSRAIRAQGNASESKKAPNPHSLQGCALSCAPPPRCQAGWRTALEAPLTPAVASCPVAGAGGKGGEGEQRGGQGRRVEGCYRWAQPHPVGQGSERMERGGGDAGHAGWRTALAAPLTPAAASCPVKQQRDRVEGSQIRCATQWLASFPCALPFFEPC